MAFTLVARAAHTRAFGHRVACVLACAAALAMALAGCATAPTATTPGAPSAAPAGTPSPPSSSEPPKPTAPPMPRNVEPPAPKLNLSGFPLPYRQGYADGCASVTGAERKDATRFSSDMNYRTGWTDGSALCKKK